MERLPLYRFCLALLSVATWGCTDLVEPDPVPGDPVFTFSGTFDSQNIAKVAGDDGVYMFTGYSSRETFQGDMLVSWGELAPENVNITEKEKIRFEINSPEIGTNIFIDSFFHTGNYQYVGATDTVLVFANEFLVSFNNLIYPADQSLMSQWIIDDSMVSTEPVIQPIYLSVGEHTISWSAVQNNDSCISSNTQSFVLRPDGSILGVSINISEFIQSNFISAQPINTVGSNMYTYVWSGNGVGQGPEYQLNPANYAGTYHVTVTEFGSLETASASLSIGSNLAQGAVNYCGNATLLDIQPQYTSISEFFELGKVTILFVDSSGTTWRSDGITQDTSDSYFEVLEVEDYLKNEQDQSTKKLKLRFRCQLANDIGQTKSFQSDGCIIGFAHP